MPQPDITPPKPKLVKVSEDPNKPKITIVRDDPRKPQVKTIEKRGQ